MSPQERTMPGPVRGVVYALLVVALVGVWFTLGGSVAIRSPEDSPVATGLVFQDLTGERIPIERYRGEIVVLNLWASWCGPCVREIPALATLQERYADRGVRVVGLNTDDAPSDRVAQIAESLGVAYDVVVPVGGLRPPFETRGVIPHTWIVDARGRLRASHAGAASLGAFDRAIRELLGES